MHTSFSLQQLSSPDMARSEEVLRKCLQCGYCLEICPTYQLLGDEFDSARGRIYLIRDMLQNGGTPEDKTVAHIDRCLSCMACMSSCPSFVNYMHLVDHARSYIENNYKRSLPDRALRWILARTLPHPGRFRLAIRAARLARPLAFVLPVKIRGLLALAPVTLPPPSPNDRPQIFPAKGERKRRVALLTGCAQKVLNTDINDATIRILCRHGCEVVVVNGAGCCGALTYHMGKSAESHAMAANNIRAWINELNGDGLDSIVINTSGCGTVVKEYAHMFRNSELSEHARTISALAKDISELLSEMELEYTSVPDLRVAYHATCSLQFGQRIRYAPKKLLKAAGFTVVEPRNSHTCCGSAGTYNLLQAELSGQLRALKVDTLERVSPDVIVAGNIGCMIQIGSGTRLPVIHTVELLDWATGGPMPLNLKTVSATAHE